MQPPINVIKIENPGYYCSSYTPPAPDHSTMMTSGAYSKSYSMLALATINCLKTFLVLFVEYVVGYKCNKKLDTCVH